jgi:hypothetical protein
MKLEPARTAALALTAAGLLLGSCAHNNLLLGRVEATVAGHKVVVTDCYRTQVDPPRQINSAEWRFTPCRDADVLIKGEELNVNGQSYGHLNPSDSVLVDHGVVSVQRATSSGRV